MMWLNNKGQSLILFILVIPILLGIMVLVIDVGNAMSKKNEIDNKIEFVIDYGLENGEVFLVNDDNGYFNEDIINWKNNLKILLDYNLNDTDNEIILNDGEIIITSKAYVDGIFSNILNIKGFKIESEYNGYIENNKKMIKKVK